MEIVIVLLIGLRLMEKQKFIDYKRKLNREDDINDIEQIENA